MTGINALSAVACETCVGAAAMLSNIALVSTLSAACSGAEVFVLASSDSMVGARIEFRSNGSGNGCGCGCGCERLAPSTPASAVDFTFLTLVAFDDDHDDELDFCLDCLQLAPDEEEEEEDEAEEDDVTDDVEEEALDSFCCGRLGWLRFDELLVDAEVIRLC